MNILGSNETSSKPQTEVFGSQWGHYHSLMDSFFSTTKLLLLFFYGLFFFLFLRFYISCFKTRSDHKSCLLNPHPIFCACTWGKEQCCALGVCWQCSCTCMCTHTELCLLVLCSYKQGMLLFGSEGGLLDILQYCQNRHVRDKIVALEGFMLLLRET